jgi:hypothetical protein
MNRPISLADSQSQIKYDFSRLFYVLCLFCRDYEERLKVKRTELKTTAENRSKQAPRVKGLKDEIAHHRVC